MRQKISKDYVNDIDNFNCLPIYSQRIRYYLNEKGITAKELNEEAGFSSPNVVPSLINGTRDLSLEAAKRICSVMGVTIDYLVGLTNIRSTETDIIQVCKYTGIDEKIINIIHQMLPTPETDKISKDFRVLWFKALNRYLQLGVDEYHSTTGMVMKFVDYIDQKKQCLNEMHYGNKYELEKDDDLYVLADMVEESVNQLDLIEMQIQRQMSQFLKDLPIDNSKRGSTTIDYCQKVLHSLIDPNIKWIYSSNEFGHIERDKSDGEHNETNK